MGLIRTSGLGRDLLIVDDDTTQVYLFRQMLRELGHAHRCHHAPNGIAALDFLYRKAPYKDAPRPELIILDINMPGMNGCEVLSKIKADPALRAIPIIMFSVGMSQDDVNRSYSAHANAYVRKPEDYEASLRVVDQIERFWCRTARLSG